MEQFMSLLDFTTQQDQKRRKMGRPPKIPPFSHYDAYKRSDIAFFISLFSGREELYNPEFSEHRQKALIFIEKKCGHFLAMRKGRNAEKLWLFLFNDFEALIRNGGDKNDASNKIVVYYDCLKFLIPYIGKSDRLDLPRSSDSDIKPPKVSKSEVTEPVNDDWLQKVIETVTHQPSPSPPPSISKHADILSCITNYLDTVPNEKLMLCKVRLFQFVEEEKTRLTEHTNK